MVRRVQRSFASFAPLKFFLAYLALTLALAIWGPIQYYMFPIGKTVLFMTAIMVSLTFGYVYGVETGPRRATRNQQAGGLFVRRLFDISLAVSLLSLGFSIASAVLSGNFSVDFSSIGDAYVDAYDGYTRNSGNYSIEFILYSLFLPFNYIAFIFGFYYFSSIGRIRRILVVSLTVVSLVFYVLDSGKQKQIGDVMIFLFAVAALKYGVRGKPIQLKWLAGGAALAVTGLFAFVVVLGQRYGVLGVDAGNVNQRMTDLIFVNFNHPIFAVFGAKTGLVLSLFLSYLSQGYYGLGLALETDWHWTHFMGFSYSVSVIGNRVFGLDWEWPNTLLYQVGLHTGWGESKWHTVFTHFATDFTFPGTVVIFGFFASIYARAWLAAVRYENPFAILMFSLLTMGAFFMPANNQMLHSPGALFTMILATIIYLWFGRRYNQPTTIWEKPRRTRMAMPHSP